MGLATFLPANLGAGNRPTAAVASVLPLLHVLARFCALSHLQDEPPPSAASADDHLPPRGA